MNELIVRRGQELTAKLWNAFWGERRRCRIFGGPGVFVKDSSDGQVISFRAGGSAYLPKFGVNQIGKFVTFRLGLVNGQEPRIEDVPITGGNGRPVPRLRLQDTEDVFDPTGRSWLAIRLQVDETGRMIQPDAEGEGPLELTIVQRASALSADPEDSTIGFHPIAVFRRPPTARKGLGTLKQIAMFDYQHRTAWENNRWRHFFDPA